MKKRFWALFLAVMMVVSVLPTTAFAEEASLTPEPNSDEYVTVSKTAERTGADEWKITMTIATDKIAIKPEPMDLVILMDTSYSMRSDISGNYYSNNTCRMEIAGPAAQKLVKDLAAADVNARVSVATFDSGASTKKGLTQLTDENLDEITSAIPDTSDETSSGFGTNMTAGLNAAAGIFTGSNIKNKVIVMLGDGEPYNDSDGNNGPKDSTLATIKNAGITVHTIGFAINSKVLENIAKKTDGNYYTTSSAEGLTAIFTDIKNELVAMVSDDMRSSTDSDVAIQDILVVPNGSSVSVSPDGKLMNWNPADGVLGENQTAIITYTVKLDNVNDFTPDKHTINLNGDAVLSYQAGEQTGTVKFPVPSDEIEVAQLVTEIYLDDELHSTKTGKKVIAWENNSFEWSPEETITVGEEEYTYLGSTYDNEETESSSAVVTAGTHTVAHYYVSEPETFGVTYEFAPNSGLPEEVTSKLTTVDDTLYPVGQIVENKAPSSYTAVEEKVGGVTVGAWTFQGWDAASKQMVEGGIIFTGTWEYQPVDKSKNTVAYQFVSENGESLPEEVTEQLTAVDSNTYYVGQTVENNAASSYTAVEETVDGVTVGTWTFQGWDAASKQMVEGGIIFTGTWTYTEAQKYTVTYYIDGVQDGDPVSYYAGESVTVKDAPQKAGYTFSGWSQNGTFTMPAENMSITGFWTAIPKYTLTFDANGGAWDAAVEGFEMNSDSNVVTKVSEYSYTLDPITQPVRDGYKFTGWYNEDIQSGAIALAGQSLRLDLILYAGWEEIQPDDVKYTVRKHYIGADGNEAAAVNLIDQTGKEGTAINTIIANYAKDQTYYGQNYTYAADKTTVEPDVEKLEAGVVIDLYYYLDTWNDEKDSITEGDDIPDMYQAAVEFKAAVNGTVGKDGEKLIQVYTNKENNVVFTPSVVTPVANEGYAFDVWYKDADFDAPVDPFVETTVAGGTKIVYTATFAKDVIGGDNGGDTIPDKYQAVVTYVVKNGTWDGTDADSKQAVFTLYEKIGGVWTPKTGVILGDTIPTGMKANATHIQSSGEWDVDIDENTAVTGDASYTYEFKTTKAPSIEVTKTVNKTSAEIGDTLTYTIVVENKGNVDLNNVIVTDAWLNKSETIATLAKGESKTFIYTYKVVGADAGKTLKNTVIAKADNLPEEKGDTAETKIKKNDPVKPVGPSKPALNKADHYAYIVGYPDGLVHPEKNITRAEVSTIFFRMLLDESREDFWAQENWFSDVPAHMWFNNAVSTLANAGLITGYPDGSFKPNANITRAEFATIAIRFFLEEDVEITENNLSDVKGHWAEANINLAYALNLINGYPDGTFRPDQKITRAEAMTIVNRVLERAPEKDHLLDDMIEWPDNMNKDAWYYAAVQEATNSHEFYRDSKNEYEVWTELLPVRDWAALEREWSQANSSKNPGEVVDINVSTPEAGN